MTTGKGMDVLGLGPSAITQLDDAFAQNTKSNTDWFEKVATGLATERGIHLTDDDRLRRELMQQLYGHGRIVKGILEEQFGICFDEYFQDELQRLEELVEQGIVTCENGDTLLGANGQRPLPGSKVSPFSHVATDKETISLTAPLGRLLVRVAAAVFDRYLPSTAFRDGLPAYMSSKVG